MRICAFIQMYNEMEKGNLVRCLENVRQWADDIVIYDDASTDDSVSVAKEYTPHIILGETNMISEELYHKQQLLELALTLSPDWIMWIDCDEIMDRDATLGGLRKLAESATIGVDGYSFHELNLWRSQTYARTDSLFSSSWFCRLWRVVPGMKIETATGVHMRLYPITIKNVERVPFEVIHYGFWDYKKMLIKIGGPLGCGDREEIQKIAPSNWILNETECSCYRVQEDVFPPENVPQDIWPEPKPLAIEDLVPYAEIESSPLMAPLLDRGQLNLWHKHHVNDYHGERDEIHKRNTNSYSSGASPEHPFGFIAKGKTIVDLGCGPGWYSLSCIKNGAKKVYCLDVDRNLLDIAQWSFDKLEVPRESYEFICLDGSQPDITEPVDIVFCLAVFMHIPLAQVRSYLAWICSIMPDDGKAYLQFYQNYGHTTFNCIAEETPQKIMDRSVDMLFLEAGLRVLSKEFPTDQVQYSVWTYYTCEKYLHEVKPIHS